MPTPQDSELNFWKSFSGAVSSTETSVTERQQQEFTNPVQQNKPDYMGYGVAIAITAILVFLLRRRK